MPSTHVALIGPGLVGKAVLAQLAALPRKFRVVAVANSKSMVLTPVGDAAANLAAALASADLASHPAAVPVSLPALEAHLAAHANPAMVDCTAHDAVAAHYPRWLAAGIHVVTPNKKGFSGDLAHVRAIRAAAREPTGESTDARAGLVYHESTVGAGLPLLSTIADLVATGDEVLAIEGVLSGTLSYLFNEYSPLGDAPNPPLAFSAIVEQAKALGYTEPDPRDDLNGLDVARKVVILARAAGLALSLADVPVHNIVPEPLRVVPDAAAFLAALPQYDAALAAKNEAARARGAVLRYVGKVDVRTGSASVELVECAADHPFAGLRGADNVVRITTARFPRGLVIQGAGAGDAVTAFGVVGDLLRVHYQGAFQP
ncbi:Homoserine dehydrogenase [Blastocladiella emersonii ATCC 22665]|nr:Homoserine dehydrogenase [Blastocladiella emersonii ATCC 22665]